VNILICSGGRRPYLTRWFRQALVRNRVEGRVAVADLDPHSPSQGEADAFFVAPRVSDSDYGLWLRELLSSESIDLAVSINDFELSVWADLRESDDSFAPLLALSASTQAMVEDKARMSTGLASGRVPTPVTRLASDVDANDLAAEHVVKGRFGSGSRGLAFTDRAGLQDAIRSAAAEVTDPAGRAPSDPAEAGDLIVVQPRIDGQEFGLDIINDLNGQFAAVLARRKISMRGGETDKATSVDPEPFRAVAAAVSNVTQHRGLIDVDVLVSDSGEIQVIDVNPRFGGGYPFSHMAGADVPAAYVAWALGRRPPLDWLSSSPGVSASKYVDIWSAGTAR